MADISVTAGSVVAATSPVPVIFNGVAGGTITAGQAIYIDTNNLVQLADAVTSLVTATAVGVSLNGGAAGQPIAYQKSGLITIGATVVKGAIALTSGNNAGGITITAADLTTGWYTQVLGICINTTQIYLTFAQPIPAITHS